MRYWLMKSEPADVGIDDLANFPNQSVAWYGVRNYLLNIPINICLRFYKKIYASGVKSGVKIKLLDIHISDFR